MAWLLEGNSGSVLFHSTAPSGGAGFGHLYGNCIRSFQLIGNVPLSVAMGLPSASFQAERSLCAVRWKAAQGRALQGQTARAGGSAGCREAGGARRTVPEEEQRVKSCGRPAWELTQSPSSTRRARSCRQQTPWVQGLEMLRVSFLYEVSEPSSTLKISQ